MRLPPISGVIERRLVVAYRVDPDRAAELLPHPLRPRTIGDAAVAAISLVRLGQLRPGRVPRWVGLHSENAVHRIAVEWDSGATRHEGLYVLRRDSDSLADLALGGRLYRGAYRRARFRVEESATTVHLVCSAADGAMDLEVAVHVSDRFRGSALFTDATQAARFFDDPADPADRPRETPAGPQLVTPPWRIEPVAVDTARSSVFDDPERFPAGAAEVDCAVLARRVTLVGKAAPARQTALARAWTLTA